MNIEIAALSERGPRLENEDSIVAENFGLNYALIGVADGLGGHSGGKIASSFAVKCLFETLSTCPGADLANAVRTIHSQLRELQTQDTSHRDMATTLSAALINQRLMKFVHCGDCRIAVARNRGIRRITVDHSEAQRLYEAGKLSREQLATYPRKNILDSALGIQGKPRIDEGAFHLREGDKIFISSDGLHNKILLREIFAIARDCLDPMQVIDRIGREMASRQADDNYSLVCAFIR